jgi:hypothetical protein
VVPVFGVSLNFERMSSTELLVLTCLFAVPLLYVCQKFLKDLRFYFLNGWDFSKDSGVNMQHGYLPSGDSKSKMSNRTRVFYGHPLFIAVFSIPFLHTVVVLLGKF